MDVSIIIPTFNRLWSLKLAIQSCRNTLCTSEIIVIDDGSTDGTWEWLQNQENLFCLKQENLGKCISVNNGFSIASGKYVRFLDSDDMLNPLAIDEQFTLAEKENADVVVSGYTVINEENALLRAQSWIYCDDFIAQQLGECDSSHYSAYLFNRNFIKDIPHRQEFSFRDDRLFVLELALKNPKIIIHGGKALAHRAHQQTRLQITKSANHITQNSQHIEIYCKILSQLNQENRLDERKISASTKILWPLANWIAKYDLKTSTELINWIYQLMPNFQIPEKGLKKLLFNILGFQNTARLFKIFRLFKQQYNRFNKISPLER